MPVYVSQITNGCIFKNSCTVCQGNKWCTSIGKCHVLPLLHAPLEGGGRRGVEEKKIYLLSRLLAHTMLREHFQVSRRKFRTHGNGARDYYLFTAANGARLVNHSEDAATAMLWMLTLLLFFLDKWNKREELSPRGSGKPSAHISYFSYSAAAPSHSQRLISSPRSEMYLFDT